MVVVVVARRTLSHTEETTIHLDYYLFVLHEMILALST
jgi:hypothetical protein